VGAVVGEKLWRLAREHQVICITHLPQLAAFADQHLRVEKVLQEGRTVVQVTSLSPAQRQGELAIMLGGETQSHLRSAADLLAKAGKRKEKALPVQTT
jgi:DNA repair protein RecN (Recombination protein N)